MIGLAGIGYGCYQLLTTPKLSVKQVKIIGTRLVDAGSVELDVRSAVVGKNILLISRGRITERVMKNRPEISQVGIGRILPKTVVVRVKERTPYAAITPLLAPESKSQPQSYLLVDPEGIPFHKSDKLSMAVPVVELSGEHYSELSLGKKSENTLLLSALACISDCRSAKCSIDKISVDPAGNLCLNIGSNFYIKLGQPVEIPKKLETLQKMLPALRDRGESLLYVDISCYDKPVWKRKINVPVGDGAKD